MALRATLLPGTPAFSAECPFRAATVRERSPCFRQSSQFQSAPPSSSGVNVVQQTPFCLVLHAVFTSFRETGTISCSCSGPRLPDELIKTADDVYIRFHGTKQ